MHSILSQARKASRDPQDCRRTIDALRRMGFDEEAFRRLHTDGMNGFYGYSQGIHHFLDDGTNHRVHQRLMYVLLSCSNGIPPNGMSFESLAEQAYRLIPPT